MIPVRLRQIEEFGIELNHQAGSNEEEHREMLDRAVYFLVSEDGKVGMVHDSGRGYFLSSVDGADEKGLLNKDDPNSKRIELLLSTTVLFGSRVYNAPPM